MDLKSGRWVVMGEELVCQLCEECDRPSLDVVTEWRDIRGQWANEKLKRAPICDKCLQARTAGSQEKT